jgi:hypothetical protein
MPNLCPEDTISELFKLYSLLSSRSSYEAKLSHSTRGSTAQKHWGRYEAFKDAALILFDRYDLLSKANDNKVPF